MNYKKFSMWLVVFLTFFTIYATFNHSPIPLLYVYLIYPFICAVGLTIAGIIGREFIAGKIILTAVICAFSMFILMITIMIFTGGLGIIYWAAALFYPLFNFLLILGLVISLAGHWYKNLRMKNKVN